MYGDRHIPGLYAPMREYEVFDLYSREHASLDTYSKVPSHGSRGFRVEAFEDTSGPSWVSSKSRYVVDVPSYYEVEFRTDLPRKWRSRIKLHRVKIDSLMNDRLIHRWSSLIGELPKSNMAGGPVPQGLSSPNLEYYSHGAHRDTKLSRLRWRFEHFLFKSQMVTQIREWFRKRERDRLIKGK
jgi:hypothetical protein